MRENKFAISEIKNFQTIIIYGAGFIGKLCFNWLLKNNIDAARIEFAETEISKKEVFGIEVKKVAQISAWDNSIVLVAARENHHKNMLVNLLAAGANEYALVTDDCYKALYAFDCQFSINCEINKQNEYVIKHIEDMHYKESLMENYFIRKMKRSVLNFEVQLAEHCNLNCAGCDHFSPIAEKNFLDVSQYAKDISRLSGLSEGIAGRIKLLGGEPLLHPEIAEIMKLTRNSFQTAYIEIVTNGLLLLTMPKMFWETCNKSNVNISITRYPINIDFDKIVETSKKYEVNLYFINEDVEKTLWKLPLDVKGSQEPSINFYKCWRINNCITLEKGKIFSCNIPAHINHFNKYFNMQIPVAKADYVDIYKISDINEIFEFLTRPLAFCRYCNIQGENSGYAWASSKKEISEWI